MVEQENPRRVWKSRRKRIEGKTQYVRVSMSESERAQLMVLEQQTGLSPSALMVEAVFGSTDPVAVQLRRNQLAELLAMRRLMASTKNFGEYREALHAANPPCIPFFGTH